MADDPLSILITGAGRGLGRAFAEAALERGYRVAGTVRDAGHAAALDALGVHAVVVDVSDIAAIAAAVSAAEATLGPIDILVNNAGFGQEGALEESTLDAMRRQFDVNVFAPVAFIRAVLPAMRRRRRGHIVNVTSMAGSVGLPGIAYYSGSKFAMEGISEALGKEVRPLGIHVTSFAPGQFRTDWAGRSMERAPRTIADYDAIVDPLRRARTERSGKQPGDPRKAADVLMTVLAAANPPPRIFVGGDALALAGQKIRRMQAEIAAWDAVGRSTDFSPSSD